MNVGKGARRIWRRMRGKKKLGRFVRFLSVDLCLAMDLVRIRSHLLVLLLPWMRSWKLMVAAKAAEVSLSFFWVFLFV